MRQGLLWLAAMGLLLSGCAGHSKSYDDAFADCQAQAIKQSETAGVPDDQRSAWIENSINACMKNKGVS